MKLFLDSKGHQTITKVLSFAVVPCLVISSVQLSMLELLEFICSFKISSPIYFIVIFKQLPSTAPVAVKSHSVSWAKSLLSWREFLVVFLTKLSIEKHSLKRLSMTLLFYTLFLKVDILLKLMNYFVLQGNR